MLIRWKKCERLFWACAGGMATSVMLWEAPVSPVTPPEAITTTAIVTSEVLSLSPEPLSAPAPSPTQVNDWIFLIVGLVGLLGLLVLAGFAWRWLRPHPSFPHLKAPAWPAPRPVAQTALSYLECQETVDGPREFSLTRPEMVIGRAEDADLCIDEAFYHWETVSRRHARIQLQGEHTVIQDLGSTNGVYVNGRRTHRNLLKDGWKLKIGGVAFIFRTGGEHPKRSAR